MYVYLSAGDITRSQLSQCRVKDCKEERLESRLIGTWLWAMRIVIGVALEKNPGTKDNTP